MRAETPLLSLQRQFVAALQEPIFGDSRSRTELGPRKGATSKAFTATAKGLLTPSATLSEVDRLELYHRQYWYRLLDSLAEDFPGLRLLLGKAAFWRVLEAYLEASPPKSFTLRHLGAGLPDFLAAHPKRTAHPVHAVELARLEYALMASFEAAEGEVLAGQALGQGAITLQPHVHRLALRTAAVTTWRRAVDGGRRPAQAAASKTPSHFVVVYRLQHVVKVERVSRAAFAVLEAIVGTQSLEQAMQQVAEQPGLLRARDAAKVTEWFATWVSRGWFTSAAPARSRAR